MAEEEFAIIVKGRLEPLKEMTSILAAAGVDAQIVRPPESDANA